MERVGGWGERKRGKRGRDNEDVRGMESRRNVVIHFVRRERERERVRVWKGEEDEEEGEMERVRG